MKLQAILSLAIALFLFSAWKKEEPSIEQPLAIEKEDPLEYAKDSVSYSINGIFYNVSKFSSFHGTGTSQPYSKVDSIVNNNYYISGRKDSVLYSRGHGIYNNQHTVNVIFIKTVDTASMIQSFFLKPKYMLDLFRVGSKNYAVDFGRDNISKWHCLKY